MNTRCRILAAVLAVCALGALGPSAAMSAPTTANLRVEGASGQVLDPGTNYVTDTPTLKTDAKKCDGSGEPHTPSFPSAIGLVQDASKKNASLDPLWVSDKWNFALIICQIGGAGAFDANEAWLYKVDHRSAWAGGDQEDPENPDRDGRLGGGEDVLWYLANFGTPPENTGKELALDAPREARATEPFSVRATAYDDEGNNSPAGDVEITGGDATAVTGQNGQTTVTASREGTVTLRGTHRPDIPTAPVKVQVSGEPDGTQTPSSSRSGGDSGGETGSRSEEGSGSGGGSGGGSGPGPARAGSGGSGPGGRSGSSNSLGDARGNAARNADGRGALAGAGGDSGGGSDRGPSGDDPETDAENAWDGKSMGELLSASHVGPLSRPAPDRAESQERPGGGAWLVWLFVALGVVVVTAAGSFLLRRPPIRTLLSRSLTSGPFSRIASNLRSPPPSSE